MRFISKKELYILVIILVYITHSCVYEYVGSVSSLEWVASFYVADYLIVALMSFLIKVDNLICRIIVNTMGIYKVICTFFIVVAYFYSNELNQFWYTVDNFAPFYMVILISILLSILSEYIINKNK